MKHKQKVSPANIIQKVLLPLVSVDKKSSIRNAIDLMIKHGIRNIGIRADDNKEPKCMSKEKRRREFNFSTKRIFFKFSLILPSTQRSYDK
jgi:CBS domain-containing protein